MADREHIIFCQCAHYDLVSADLKESVLDLLRQSGSAYTIVPDLCQLCAERSPDLARWADISRLTIIACYPRAVKWLFYAGNIELDESNVRFVNMRTAEIDDIAKQLRMSPQPKEQPPPDHDPPKGWIPWFPVIDYDRCVNCKKCMDFCLFGTYALDNRGRVQVQTPSACKTNCPACARVCPQSAIIFPKYNAAPINGDDVTADNTRQSAANVDYDELLTDNVLEQLRNRREHKRFSPDAPAKRNTGTLADALGIPPEVLAGLSPDDRARVRQTFKHTLNEEQNESKEPDDLPEQS